MQTEIKHRWFYAAPPETIWEYLTRAELLSQWVMPNDIKPIRGHHFMFTIKPIPEMDFDGKVYCEILEILPFKKLVYSWKSGPEQGKITIDSLVTWILVPKNNGTELFIEHTGFGAMATSKIFHGMNDGWKQNMRKIEDLINLQKAHETVA